jgi:hypothetical protein
MIVPSSFRTIGESDSSPEVLTAVVEDVCGNMVASGILVLPAPGCATWQFAFIQVRPTPGGLDAFDKLIVTDTSCRGGAETINIRIE